MLDIQNEVRELFAEKMREFTKFCAEHWTLKEKELAEFHPGFGEEYRQGYNAAMTDGIAGALDLWLEDESGIS
jgi:hypothetical protein